MTGNVRIVKPGEETDEAVAAARVDFEDRYRSRFGYAPPQDAVDKWWPLGGENRD